MDNVYVKPDHMMTEMTMPIAHLVTFFIVTNVLIPHNIVQYVPPEEFLLMKMIQFVFVQMELGMIMEHVKIVVINV